MSITAEKLPLPHRDARKNKLPRRCPDAMAYKLAAAAMVFKKVPNFTATTVVDQKY
jgi:hypothetical protein